MKHVEVETVSTITKKCKDCGKQFTYSSEEAQWLLEKGFEQYKRCPDCRRKNKQLHKVATTQDEE